MKIEFLTLFPGYFSGPLSETMLHRGQERQVVTFSTRDIREYAAGKHRVTDDTPFGGGAGMVMKPEPLAGAIDAARAAGATRVILLSPRGAVFTQAVAERLATYEHVALVCGRYEGVDARVSEWVDEELSVGDYVLSGGEPAALAVADAVARLIPGVLGHPESARDESFVGGVLEYPHYTRPREFRGMTVPEVLLNGDHQAIATWRRQEALRITQERRPDLLAKKDF